MVTRGLQTYGPVLADRSGICRVAVEVGRKASRLEAIDLS